MTRAIRRLAICGAGADIKGKWQDDRTPGWQHDATTYFDLIMPAVHMMCRENAQCLEDRVRIMAPETADGGKKDRAERLDTLLAMASKTLPADIFVRYKHEADLGVPSKLSVSALKRRSEEPLLRPSALPSVHDDISAAARGTLMHKVLQKIGLQPKSTAEVMAFAEGMAEQGMIDTRDTAYVDADAIVRFLDSSLAARARCAERVFSEAPFCLTLGAREVGVAESDEPIVVQGVIDLCFIEDGQWVIVDYKTDRIDTASAGAAAQKYSVQLELYEKALAAITPHRIKQKYIYFLETDQAVLLP
jgi:ATP-dependent exoDNAse (exonuclease V) beta subunit